MKQPTSRAGWVEHYLHALYDSMHASTVAKDITIDQSEIFVVEADKHRFVRDMTVKGEVHVWGELMYRMRTMYGGARFVLYEGGKVMLYV